MHYVLDLSRLISSAARPAPTGIDRVEIAYAREFLWRPASEVTFAAMTLWGRFGLLDHDRVRTFIAALNAQWYSGGEPYVAKAIAASLCRSIWLRGESALHRRLKRCEAPIVYLNVSHHHLDRPASIVRLKTKSGVFFVPLVHDLIPIEFPEYSRPKQDEVHKKRISTVSGLADAIIVTSLAIENLLTPKLVAARRSPPVLVGSLGLDLSAPSIPLERRIPSPYFICIGTIEPRKNHLLLLKLWRRMAIELGLNAPHLVLVGRRGWENENVVDMLDRCLSFRGKVHEFSSLTDSEVCGLIQGAEALLLPSFSEGYGLPLIEALALGVPALCSNIPALLEVGGAIPEFFDPLDGPSWYRAILDYARPNSPRRSAQIDRLKIWVPPSWKRHFEQVDVLLENLVTNSASVEG